MVGWTGKWSVSVGWDVFIVENVSIVLREFFEWDLDGAVIFLF